MISNSRSSRRLIVLCGLALVTVFSLAIYGVVTVMGEFSRQTVSQMTHSYCVFVRETDRGRSIIMARLVNDNEKVGYPHRFMIDIQVTDSSTATDECNRIEVRIAKELSDYGAEFVGHVLADLKYVSVWYAKLEPPDSVKVRVGLLRSEQFKIAKAHDPQWQYYEEHLAPNAMERQSYRNQGLLHQLAKDGDVSDRAREVEFAFLFPSLEQYNGFLAEVAGRGYAELVPPSYTEEHGDYWCELMRHMPITEDIINAETAYLEEAAERHGGEYDGWQTPIVKQ